MFTEISEIRFVGSFSIFALESFALEVKPNMHGEVEIFAVIEKKFEKAVLECMDQPIEFRAKGEDDIEESVIFSGIVNFVRLRYKKGIYRVNLKAVSHTIRLDIEKKRMSFQNQSMSYKKLFQEIVKKNYNGDVQDLFTQGKTIQHFVLQYDETDWEFLKRLVSQLNGVLIPDVCAKEPKIYIGFPNLGQKSAEDAYYKDTELFMQNYYFTKSNEKEKDVKKHIRITVDTDENYELGMRLLYRGRALTIVEKFIDASVADGDGCISKFYTLQELDGCYQNKIYKENDTGLLLYGKVLERKKNQLQIQLDIDKRADPSSTCWFTLSTLYMANGNTGQYMMPEKGETIALYLPNRNSQHAIVVGVKRRDGEDNPKVKDPDCKYLSNQTGKQLEMAPDRLSWTVSEGKMFLNLTKNGGIQVTGSNEIVIHSQDDLCLQGEKITINAKNECTIAVNGSSIVLDNSAHIKGSRISELGTPAMPLYQEHVLSKVSTSAIPTELVTEEKKKKKEKKKHIVESKEEEISGVEEPEQTEETASTVEEIEEGLDNLGLEEVGLPPMQPVVRKKTKKTETFTGFLQGENGRFTVEKQELVKDSQLTRRTRDFKRLLPKYLQGKFNFSYAYADINTLDKKEYYAHSNFYNFDFSSSEEEQRLKDISLAKKKNIFQTMVLDEREVTTNRAWDRKGDSEYKILEDIASNLGKNREAEGTILMMTDLFPCKSCINVFGQFTDRYPNINLEVIYRKDPDKSLRQVGGGKVKGGKKP